MVLAAKFIRLKKIIAGYESCLVAYSAGVDSTLLLKAALTVLPKDKVLAVTAVSETYPEKELAQAKSLARQLGARHKIIRTAELKNKKFTANPRIRCYFCKKELFSKLKLIAKKNNLNFVLDASNLTDKKDYRPGAIAKKELEVISPLAEAGFTKEDIRSLSKKLKLPTWDKPALACLASRIPYGTEITADLLKRIQQAEVYLTALGFFQVRLRHYGSLCRIEVPEKNIVLLARRRKEIINRLKKIGYNYITLDLEGYRTGSLHREIK